MKKLLPLFLILAVLSAYHAHAQFPGIQWRKCLGGSGDELAYAMRPTYDSGYIIAGSSRSDDGNVTGNHGGLDFWIVKVSDTGGILWQKSLGGSGDEEPTSILQTWDSGYIVAGYTTSADGQVTGHHGTPGSADYWIVKLSATGNIQWQKPLGGSGNELAQSIYATKDGGYIVAGYSNSTDGDVTGNHGSFDYWLVKLSDSGAIQWQASFGGSNDDFAYSVQQTGDDGYIIAGYSGSFDGDITTSHGDFDYWLVKLSEFGALQWQKTYGGSNLDEGLTVQQTADFGYIIGGNSFSDDGDVTGHHNGTTFQRDVWIAKTDDTGAIQWQKSLGGTGGEVLTSILPTYDGNFLVTAGSESSDGDVIGHIDSFDSWVLELSPAGDIMAQKCLGGSGYDAAFAIYPSPDGGLVILNGTTSTDSEVYGNHGNYDYWLVKLKYPGTTSAQSLAELLITIIPNPATSSFTVSGITPTSVKLYDALGNLATEANNTNIISVASLPPGVYLVVVLDEHGTVTYRTKVVKM